MYNPQYLRNNSNYLAPFQNRLNGYKQQQMAAMQPQQPIGNNIIWVSGLSGANSGYNPYYY